MSIYTEYLSNSLANGYHEIGQVTFEIEAKTEENPDQESYLIKHQTDQNISLEQLNLLTNHDELQAITVWGTDDEYRFLKGSNTLKNGWYYRAANLNDLVQALQTIYPASISLLVAHNNKQIRSQSFSEKLSRQTGMYGRTKNISNEGAEKLIAKTCTAPNCDKICLWDFDNNHNQITSMPAAPRLPLICQEPCNHLVASCRPIVKQEWEASQAQQT